jgi:hypothetical protein
MLPNVMILETRDFMTRVRMNDRPEDGTYVSRAMQAIKEGIPADDEAGDKQAGDGLIQVSVEGIQRGLNIAQELKENGAASGDNTEKLDELERILRDMLDD